MICIDSDCIIDFLRNKREARDVIAKYKDDIVTTEINIFEVFFRLLFKKIIDKNEEELTREFFDSVDILNMKGWGIKSANILTNLIKQGRLIEQNDCFIASIMLVNGCNKIITKNIDHFSRIKNIEIITY